MLLYTIWLINIFKEGFMDKRKKVLTRSDFFVVSKAIKIPVKSKRNKEDLSKKISEMVNIYDF